MPTGNTTFKRGYECRECDAPCPTMWSVMYARGWGCGSAPSVGR